MKFKFGNNQFFNMLGSFSPYLPRVTVGSFLLFGLYHFGVRANDHVAGSDPFSLHIEKHRKKNLFSGLLPPMLPTTEQLALNAQHFPELSSIVPVSEEAYRAQNALQTPVKIKPLSALDPKVNASLDKSVEQTVVVGGPPAMMSAYVLAKHGKKMIYINDNRRRAIADGSARHLEEDAYSEAPTGYRPTTFLMNQAYRALFAYVSYAETEKTGLYPWRELDWAGFLKNPTEWLPAIRLAYYFQLQTMMSKELREERDLKLALQCSKNAAFYEKLNADLGGKFLQQGLGSIYMARSESEFAGYDDMQKAVEGEGRRFIQRTPADMLQRFGFIPNAKRFYEKMHDRSFPATYLNKLTQYYRDQGASVVDGTLVNLYADKGKEGIVAEYRHSNGDHVFVACSRLIASLGSQYIYDENGKRLFDLVKGQGVSIFAHVYVEQGKQFPGISVAGETNHINKLSTKSAPVMRDGKLYNVDVIVMTSSACIGPNVPSKDKANFSGVNALGLVSAVRQTYGKDVLIEPFFATGCDRMVSRFGQTTWIKPYPGMQIQLGAGGGGLTRAPDLAVELEAELHLQERFSHSNGKVSSVSAPRF